MEILTNCMGQLHQNDIQSFSCQCQSPNPVIPKLIQMIETPGDKTIKKRVNLQDKNTGLCPLVSCRLPAST